MSSMFDDTVNITIDIKRLRLRDMEALRKIKADSNDLGVLVPLLSRLTGVEEEAIWDWDFETLMTVQKAVSDEIDNIVKKTNGGALR